MDFINRAHPQTHFLSLLYYYQQHMNSNVKYLKNGEFSYDVQTGLLGKGAFGSVYKGVITKTGQIVAIKALSLKLLKQYGDEIKEIMINEVAVMKDLSNMMFKTPCPFIVKIYDCFLTQNHVYLVLEFCDDGDLSGDLQKRGKIPEQEAKVIIYQIVRALDFIADLGIIHRDLKPDNVFKQKAKSRSIYKLGDFGLAINKNRDTQTAGTAPYMAPEMIKGDVYGMEIDIFSLGCVAHQILFGEIYFLGQTEAEVRQLVLKKPYKIPSPNIVSPQMADFLEKCHKKNRHQRIKHKELRHHPVFKDLEENYSIMFGDVDKSKFVSQASQSSQSSRTYNPNYTITFEQSSQVQTTSKNVNWRVNNEIHKALFLQEIGRRLLHVQRENTISIYLIKDCLYRLNRIRESFKNNVNFTSESQQSWKEFCNSKQFKAVYDYLTKILDDCVNLYQVEHQVFTNYLSKHPQQNTQEMMRRLGANKNENIDEQAVFAQLFSWSQFLAQKQDESSKILAQECILALKIDSINFDFYSHLKEREQLSSHVLLHKIKSLG